MTRRRVSNARLLATINRQEIAVRDAFLSAIASHKNSINTAVLVELLEAGNITGAASLLAIPSAVLFPLDAAITGTYTIGGASIPAAAPSFAVNFGFDGRAERPQQWALDNAARLVVEISTEQTIAIQNLLQRQLSAGANAQTLARDIAGRLNRQTGLREGGIIGLTDSRIQTVERVRDDLNNLSRNYFTRSLRDKRFDGIIRRAINDKKPLKQVDVERITARYADRALAHRATTIARNETVNALRAGRREGIEQGIEQGAIGSDRLTKSWSATLDGMTRSDHAAIDGQSVEGIDGIFTLPDGSQLLEPGDGSLGADESQLIQCRCYTDYIVDWLRA